MSGVSRPWPPITLEDKLAALDLATGTYRCPGELVTRIHGVFHTNPIRFWQHVNRMLTDHDVIAARPIQCRQLREHRATGPRRAAITSWTVSMRLTCCQDRKSTRLNSSHLGTSYAVF